MDPDDVRGAMKEAASDGRSAGGDANADNGAQAAGPVEQAAGTAQNAYGRAKDAVREVLDRAPEAWSRAVDGDESRQRPSASTLRDRLNRQPFARLLIAGAIGYLIGWAVHRRG